MELNGRSIRPGAACPSCGENNWRSGEASGAGWRNVFCITCGEGYTERSVSAEWNDVLRACDLAFREREAELARLRADNASLTAALEAADALRLACESAVTGPLSIKMLAVRTAAEAYDRARRGAQ